MGARRKARKHALDILYGAELRGLPLATGLQQAAEESSADDGGDDRGQPLRDYTVALVQGVADNQLRLDEVLETHSVAWSLARMPAVDRNLLRIGAYEVLLVDDVPDAVAISEAVQLAQDLSTDESAAFVNGVLARIAELRPSLAG